MASQIRHYYEFGPYRLEPSERLLLCGDSPVDVTPKAFDTLLQLVEHSGRLLEKNTLMESVWGSTAVEENNLTQMIYVLRKALHEGEGGLRFIETVPRKGYRFAAPVEERRVLIEPPDAPSAAPAPLADSTQLTQSVDVTASATPGNGSAAPLPARSGDRGSAPSSTLPVSGQNPAETLARSPAQRAPLEPPPAAAAPAAPGPVAKWLRFNALGLAVLAIMAALVVLPTLHGLRARLLGRTAAAPIRSLAVLPLQNLTGDPKQDYFADGMTDELITDLAQLHGIRVISRTSVMQFKGTSKTLPEIARELNVDAVIEGSLARSGGRVRIRAQLVRGATDTHLWAGTFERDLRDVLALQGEIAQAIASQVSLQVTPEEQARLAAPGTVDAHAYDLYLMGRTASEQGTNEGLGKGIAYFTQAVAEDPNDAPAYAGLADAYALLGMDGARPSEVMGKALAAASKAVQLDDRLAEAHTSLAGVKALYDWDWPGAEREFQRALELNPQYAPAHHRYAVLYLAPLGRTGEAIMEMQRTLELDPRSVSATTDLCWMYYFDRQYDAAIASCRKAVEMDSGFVQAHLRLGQAYLAKGMYDQAFAEGQADQRIVGGPSEAIDTAARVYRQAGYRGYLAWSLLSGPASAVPSGGDLGKAIAYTLLGRNTFAVRQLQLAVASHLVPVVYLKVDPEWDPLHSDPRYQQLLRRIGLTSPGEPAAPSATAAGTSAAQ